MECQKPYFTAVTFQTLKFYLLEVANNNNWQGKLTCDTVVPHREPDVETIQYEHVNMCIFLQSIYLSLPSNTVYNEFKVLNILAPEGGGVCHREGVTEQKNSDMLSWRALGTEHLSSRDSMKGALREG
jgi:hypothetical protein